MAALQVITQGPHWVTMQNLDKLHFKDSKFKLLQIMNNLTLFLHFLQFDNLHVFSLQVPLTAVVTMGVTAPPRPPTPVSAGQGGRGCCVTHPPVILPVLMAGSVSGQMCAHVNLGTQVC